MSFAMKKYTSKMTMAFTEYHLQAKKDAELIVKDSKVGNFVIDGDNIYTFKHLKRMR